MVNPLTDIFTQWRDARKAKRQMEASVHAATLRGVRWQVYAALIGLATLLVVILQWVLPHVNKERSIHVLSDEMREQFIAQSLASQNQFAQQRLSAQYRSTKANGSPADLARASAMALHDQDRTLEAEALLADALTLEEDAIRKIDASIATQQKARADRVSSAIQTRSLICASIASRAQYIAAARCYNDAYNWTTKEADDARMEFRVEYAVNLANHGVATQSEKPIRKALAILEHLASNHDDREHGADQATVQLERQRLLVSLLSMTGDPAALEELHKARQETEQWLPSGMLWAKAHQSLISTAFIDDPSGINEALSILRAVGTFRDYVKALTGNDTPVARVEAEYDLAGLLVRLAFQDRWVLEKLEVMDTKEEMVREAIELLGSGADGVPDSSSRSDSEIVGRLMPLCFARMMLVNFERTGFAADAAMSACSTYRENADSSNDLLVSSVGRMALASAHVMRWALFHDESDFEAARELLEELNRRLERTPGYVETHVRAKYALAQLTRLRSATPDHEDMAKASRLFTEVLRLPAVPGTFRLRLDAAGWVTQLQHSLSITGSYDPDILNFAMEFLVEQSKRGDTFDVNGRVSLASRAAGALTSQGRFVTGEQSVTQAINILEETIAAISDVAEPAGLLSLEGMLAESYLVRAFIRIKSEDSGWGYVEHAFFWDFWRRACFGVLPDGAYDSREAEADLARAADLYHRVLSSTPGPPEPESESDAWDRLGDINFGFALMEWDSGCLADQLEHVLERAFNGMDYFLKAIKQSEHSYSALTYESFAAQELLKIIPISQRLGHFEATESALALLRTVYFWGLVGPASMSAVQYYVLFGDFLLGRAEAERAEKFFRRAISMLKNLSPSEGTDLTTPGLEDRSMPTSRVNGQNDHQDLLETEIGFFAKSGLARAYAQQHRCEAAKAELDEAVAIREALLLEDVEWTERRLCQPFGFLYGKKDAISEVCNIHPADDL